VNKVCRNVVGLFLLCGWALSSWADVFDYPVTAHPANQQALQQLTAQVHQQGSLAGQFVQTKHMQILARPIITQGQFSLNSQSFVWLIEKPFTIRYEFSGQTLWREMDDERQMIQPSDEPLLYGFFSFFFSLFDLSEASLEKMFTVYFLPSTTDKTWVLGLKPKQAMLARSLQQLQITGVDTQIQQVQLLEPGGDSTELVFTYTPGIAPAFSASDISTPDSLVTDSPTP
jgi:hypothetical protein